MGSLVRVDKYELPDDLYYWGRNPDGSIRGRTWARVEPDGRVRVGLTDRGQDMAGKILFVRLRPKGSVVEQGKPIGTVETAKWTGPIEAPVSGVIDEVNEELRRRPSLINEDPYGRGWMVVIKPSKLDEDLRRLLRGDEAVKWLQDDLAKK
ncbi:MAG: biotin/lipoyl-containing protein [Candidatus Nezhaarchaeales archaeon]